MNNTGSSLVAGGGSRTTINNGGTLTTAAGTTVKLNGALLVSNGTQNGVLDIKYGSTAKGTGIFGTVSVGTGGKFGNNGLAGGDPGFDVGGALSLNPNLGQFPIPFVGPLLSAAPGTITVGGLILGAGSSLGTNVQNGFNCDGLSLRFSVVEALGWPRSGRSANGERRFQNT